GARVGAGGGLAAASGPAGARGRVGHVLEVGVVQRLLRAGVADHGVHAADVALPVQRQAVLRVVGLVDPLLAQELVLGGGVGHVAQDHHAVLGQGAVVVLVDRLQRAAAGGRVRRRVVLVFGGVVAAEHGVEGQAEAAAGPVLQ